MKSNRSSRQNGVEKRESKGREGKVFCGNKRLLWEKRENPSSIPFIYRQLETLLEVMRKTDGAGYLALQTVSIGIWIRRTCPSMYIMLRCRKRN